MHANAALPLFDTLYHAVFHFIDGIEDIQRPMVMRDDNHAGALVVRHLCEQFHNLAATLAVES